MAVIASLAASLTVRVSKFESGFKKAAAIVSRFGRRALIAGAGMAYLTRTSFQSIDTAAKLSDTIGISIQDLRRLQYAADLSGSSVEGMNKSLGIMVRRLGEAKRGTGQAVISLRKLELSADTLTRKSPREAIEDIAEAINRLPTSADRAAAAAGLFGKSAIELLPTLSLGKSGLQELSREFDRTRGVITRAQATGVEKFNDAVTTLKSSLGGVADTLAISLAPGLENVTKHFTNLIVGIQGISKDTIDSVKSWTKLIIEMGVFITVVPRVMGVVRTLIKGFKSLAKAQAFTLALGGPAGIAALAVGLAAGVGAGFAVDKAFDKIGKLAETPPGLQVTPGTITPPNIEPRSGKSVEVLLTKLVEETRGMRRDLARSGEI